MGGCCGVLLLLLLLVVWVLFCWCFLLRWSVGIIWLVVGSRLPIRVRLARGCFLVLSQYDVDWYTYVMLVRLSCWFMMPTLLPHS